MLHLPVVSSARVSQQLGQQQSLCMDRMCTRLLFISNLFSPMELQLHPKSGSSIHLTVSLSSLCLENSNDTDAIRHHALQLSVASSKKLGTWPLGPALTSKNPLGTYQEAGKG